MTPLIRYDARRGGWRDKMHAGLWVECVAPMVDHALLQADFTPWDAERTVLAHQCIAPIVPGQYPLPWDLLAEAGHIGAVLRIAAPPATWASAQVLVLHAAVRSLLVAKPVATMRDIANGFGLQVGDPDDLARRSMPSGWTYDVRLERLDRVAAPQPALVATWPISGVVLVGPRKDNALEAAVRAVGLEYRYERRRR